MSMTQEEINKATDDVMELRPTGTRSPKEPPKNPTVTQRMSDIQFQKEMAAIMENEPVVGSAFYFRNMDAGKARKNMKFTPYHSGVK
ncbi:hypothetical protein [Vibrio diazotrophicus]|uniref:Uncharacterized protein n=1 Tax=Vibrio diazotrophicus TaxID=685 RepID=A0ABX4W680_VIBDI|nr:hypothetical protein [Vibrio diazotrophicus]PNH99268.1 hypothetical protein C1O25_18110 [Vibrio diazotrophicus]